jgi:ParB family chromosome partitioning protein
MSNTTATAYEVGHLYEVDPGTLKIGANVRTDPRPDAKEFAASIKTRGVLEVISAYVDPDGGLTVLRGQRRSLVAAKVGTPTGTVPVRVVPAPEEADRIIDQASENLHREAMHTRETRDAVEQLAMLGVSAAQIAKRVALPRATVDAALKVTRNPATKDRMDATGMTLEEAAIFAEFEDDPDAIDTLTAAWEDSWRRRQIPHIVQRLRDERAEARALQDEVDRLRAEGLPVLDPGEVPADLHRHAMANLRTDDGGIVPEETWPTVTGAAVAVTVAVAVQVEQGVGACRVVVRHLALVGRVVAGGVRHAGALRRDGLAATHGLDLAAHVHRPVDGAHGGVHVVDLTLADSAVRRTEAGAGDVQGSVIFKDSDNSDDFAST